MSLNAPSYGWPASLCGAKPFSAVFIILGLLCGHPLPATATFVGEFVDPAAAAALQRARDELSEFMSVLEMRRKGARDPRVRVIRSDGPGAEALWLSRVYVSKGKIFGRVESKPRTLAFHEPGTLISVDPSIIVDWSYFDVKTGRHRGHFTTCAALKKEPAQVRARAIERKKLECTS